MKRIALLENPIREYAWGSHRAIAELCGRPAPTPEPQAELWMGAHRSAPSRLHVGTEVLSLCELIEREPEALLGQRVCARFGPRLPFLFKVLAAEKPLSIQAHPDAAQAREGFARENARGVALDAPERNYRDASPKPELICALSPFQALRGFRSPAEIRDLFDRLATPALDEPRRALDAKAPGDALRALLQDLLAMPEERRRTLVDEASQAAARHRDEDPAFEWIERLAGGHPGDPGVLAPAFLHHLRLEPGEAMFLPAGELHAYLGGVALEIMANSDNVLRGGLTQKHVDVPELMRVLCFRESPVERLRPQPDAHGAHVYPAPAREFELARIDCHAGRGARFPGRGVEILLCTEGAVRVAPLAEAEGVALGRGESCLVPAAAGGYRLEGAGTLYRAAVPN